MDRKKLDKWADLLLDTGKRNNLINFRDTRTTTAEILLPTPDELFNKIDGTTTFEVFDPKITEEDEAECSISNGQLQIEEAATAGGKAAFLARYSPKIKRQKQIILYSSLANPLTAAKNIDKKAREFIEETGVNVAYMAFGFIHWKESSSSDYVFQAPILLVPIHLEQESAVSPYLITSTGDDIIVNPTFAYKMDVEHGVKLPDYHDEDLSTYLEKIRRIVGKLEWSVTSECKIGIFSFLKINMYRDLKDNAAVILANQNIRQLLGEPVHQANVAGSGSGDSHVSNPLIELHSVVDADSSQIEAIEMAKAGKSFVLQGPPGTGKSQTITNIIAECLSDGKKVLFVSEKLAALNVVYEKLKQAGLSEFCLELHSHKANKKAVIADICHTLRTGRSALSTKAEYEIALKEKSQRQLDAYAFELHKQHPVIEKSLYQLYEEFAALRDVPSVEWAVPQLATKGESFLSETVSLLEQYVDYIPSVGYDYRNNPWYGYVNQDISYQEKSVVKTGLISVVQLLQELLSLSQEMTKRYGISCDSITNARIWRDFFQFASASQIITPSLLHKNRFETADLVWKDLQIQSADILTIQTAIMSVFDEDIYKIDGAEYYKRLTKEFNGIFSRIFNSEYRQLIRTLRLCKKDGKKPSYAEATNLMEQLADYQQRIGKFNGTEALIKDALGTAYVGIETDWSYMSEQMEMLRAIMATGVSFGHLTTSSEFTSEQTAFASYADKLNGCLNICDDKVLEYVAGCFDRTILDVTNNGCSLVMERCNACLKEMDKRMCYSLN